jgi:hypothetical protein
MGQKEGKAAAPNPRKRNKRYRRKKNFMVWERRK